MISTITIRNPAAVKAVVEEEAHGAGRNAAETAENLILDSAERRRAERLGKDKQEAKSRRSRHP